MNTHSFCFTFHFNFVITIAEPTTSPIAPANPAIILAIIQYVSFVLNAKTKVVKTAKTNPILNKITFLIHIFNKTDKIEPLK